MAQVLEPRTASTAVSARASSLDFRPAYQAYWILYIGFLALPIVAGLDKFFRLLAGWDMDLAPWVSSLVPLSEHTFMLAVGATEIVAGLVVLSPPQMGAYIVALWMLGIIVNRLLAQTFFDIALRELGLALGALVLAQLSREFNPRPLGV
jgi:hypothetical protein